jgi:hypothetical protein
LKKWNPFLFSTLYKLFLFQTEGFALQKGCKKSTRFVKYLSFRFFLCCKFQSSNAVGYVVNFICHRPLLHPSFGHFFCFGILSSFISVLWSFHKFFIKSVLLHKFIFPSFLSNLNCYGSMSVTH